jgi:hypothetical protein
MQRIECLGAASAAGDSEPIAARMFSASLLHAIPRVTEEEIVQAFASTCAVVSASDDAASVSASLRSVHVQNNVLFRMIIHSGIFQNFSGMLNGRWLLSVEVRMSRITQVCLQHHFRL